MDWRTALSGLCGIGSTACLALALAPCAPGRLGYYALVCGASLPRSAALGALGVLLSPPAGFHAGGKLGRLAGLLSLISSAGSLLVSASALRTAREHELSVSPADGLRGRLDARLAPRTVVFASGKGRQFNADIYAPTGGHTSRVGVVVVHGGAWRHGDKGENAPFSRWLAAHGFLVADIQYSLATERDWLAAVDDIKAAISYVRQHAAELNIDPQRIVILGRSAGGHLALLAAYTADVALRPWRVVALYAPTDLVQLYQHARGQQGRDLREGLHALIGGPPADNRAAYQSASPVQRVPGDAPPTLLIHGRSDTSVPVEHSRRLYRILRRAGARAELIELPFARHAFDLVPEGLWACITAQALLKFAANTQPRARPGG